MLYMVGAEFPLPDQPMPPSGEQPPLPQASHLIAARLSIGMTGDLAAVQQLSSELGEWLRARAGRNLGSTVVAAPEMVSLSYRAYRELDLAEAPDRLLSPQEDLRKRLGTTVKEALQEHADLKYVTGHNLYSSLEQFGMTEVRDIFVVGQPPVYFWARGPVTGKAIRQAVAGEVPELEWLEAPAMHDIVRYCDSLDDVTAAVLGDYGRAEYVVRRSNEPYRRRRANEQRRRISVQDVLDSPKAQAESELIEAAKRFQADFLRALARRAPGEAN
jgi:hypothetical protein